MIILSKVKDKCGKCGAKISPGYDFYLSCGTKFSEIPPSTKTRSSKSTIETIPKTREEKRQKRHEIFRFQMKVGLILGGIGGICILIGYLFNIFPLTVIGPLLLAQVIA